MSCDILSDIKKLYSIESPQMISLKESPPTDSFLLNLENNTSFKKEKEELVNYINFYEIKTDINKIKKIIYKKYIKS